MGDWGSLKNHSPSLDFLSLFARSGQPLISMGTLAELDFSPTQPAIISPKFEDRSSSDFCTDDNLEQCIHYLNQELSSLGMPQVSSDCVCLVNRFSDLLRTQQQHNHVKEELECKLHRLTSDLNYYKSSNNRLKKDSDQLERELDQEKEKYRQLTNKYKSMASKLKTEKEEIRQLNSVMQHRDLQSKHEMKKKERELMGLKERLQKLIVAKSPCRKMEMDMPNQLQRVDGKRSTWKTVSSSKHEEEMYQVVIGDLEAKHQELIVQNTELKECLIKIQKQLSLFLHEDNITGKNSLSYNENNHSFSTISEEEDSPSSSPRSSEHSEDHYHLIYDAKALEKNVEETCRLLAEKLQHRKEIKESTTCFEKNSSPIRRRHSSAGLTSPVSKKDEDLVSIKQQVELYKQIIHQQEELLRQSMHTAPHILAQSFANLEEKENISSQQKQLLEEKQRFLEEQKKFTDATIRLAEERARFQSDKISVLKNDLIQSIPFREGYNNSVKKDRLLPSTPSTSNTAQSTPKMPSSVELYRALGLTPKVKLK